MTTINRKQPMRPAEIDLLNQVDTNTADIATQTERLTQEIADRTNGDNALQYNIDTEKNERKAADTTLQSKITVEQTRAEAAESALATNLANETMARTEGDTKLQASIDNVNAKFPVQSANIGDSQVTAAKLEQAIKDQLTFLQSVPAQEFGTSNMIDVPANSSTSIDINFGSAKNEAPIVLCSLRHTSGNLTCIVTGITDQKFSVTVYNLSSTNASGVTVDWLAISGR